MRYAIPALTALAACAANAPAETFTRSFAHDGSTWVAECRLSGAFGRATCMVVVEGFGADCQATERHRDVLDHLAETCGPVIDLLLAGGLPEAVQVAEPD